jgi:periplasmic protein TonB
VPRIDDEKLHGEKASEIQLKRPNPAPANLALPRGGAGLAAGDLEVEAQRKRMLIALVILLVALGAVIAKDWDFWFPTQVESPEAVALRKAKALVENQNPAPVPHEQHKPARVDDKAAAPMAATTERTVLPPLQVDVVAGNRSMRIPANNSAIHVDVGSGVMPPGVTAAPGIAPSSSAASSSSSSPLRGGVQVSPQAAQSVTVSVPPDYPLLARQMKVQGVVSLQALIARDGTIQELQILSGPEILATAAREAVKQWHFKPYLQNGQPVETQARITVNFTISTN